MRYFFFHAFLMISLFVLCDFSQALVPHRASYKIALVSAASNSEVIDAEGIMELKMVDVCDGWTVEQRSDTTLSLASASVDIMSSRYVAWESKEGDKLRFYTNRVHNGMVSEDIKGEASFEGKDGDHRIYFQSPEPFSVSVSPGTIPPVKHLIALLKAAQSGQKIVSSEVFDGSSFGNPVHINTFITKQKPYCGVKRKKDLTGPVYPMQLAVYGAETQDALPNLEIQQIFYANGVMCSYTVDFGDYKVKGTLENVEYLPVAICQKKPALP